MAVRFMKMKNTTEHIRLVQQVMREDVTFEMLKKMFPPNNLANPARAEAEGISAPTLYA